MGACPKHQEFEFSNDGSPITGINMWSTAYPTGIEFII